MGLVVAGIAATAFAAGCSGDAEPKLSDSANALVEARQAFAAGDEAKAIELLSASIESEPSIWAYLDRAKIYATQGNDAGAQADCEAALKLAPENKDIPWIQGELKKPKDKRFQGAFALPPSAKK
jgi:Tfp pilus assembly protein PilF